ncbi:MAG: S1 family peptidase [Bdellovibrionota bacterium]
MKLFSVIFVLGSLSSSAFARDLILGGQEVKAADPIQASTVGVYSPSADGQSGALCTGTLIKKDIALTAAHCIEPGGPKPVVIFGKDLHSAQAAHRAASAVAVDSKWRTHAGKGMDQGDIALVKFGGGLPAGFHQAPTVAGDSEIKTGSDVVLAGYGINNARTKTGAGRLRKTRVRIVNSRPGKSEMIMDQTHGRGACHGDSGGPAFLKRHGKVALAGLTNRGYPDNAPDDCAHQVIYTKVPAYRSWIQSNEKKLEQSHRPATMRLRRVHAHHRRMR